ncbi:MAG: hypothetical protein IOD12_07020 [Silvanigrellales bacterium]|nr:hypothetical protein [Silvanigrellales bacterium]
MIRSSTRFVAAILVPATFFCTLEGCKPKKSQSGALTQQTLPSNRMGTLTWTLTLKPRVDAKDEEDLQCWYFYENRLSWFVEQSTAANKFDFLKDVVEDTYGADGVVRSDVQFPIRFVNSRPLPLWAIEKAVTSGGQALSELFVAYNGTQAAKDALDQKSLIGSTLIKDEIALLDAAVQEQYDALYFNGAQPQQVDTLGPLPSNQIVRYDCPEPTNVVQAILVSLAQNPDDTRVRIIESNALMSNGIPIEDGGLGQTQVSLELQGMNLAPVKAAATAFTWLFQAGRSVFVRNADDTAAAVVKTPWWRSLLGKVGINKNNADEVLETGGKVLNSAKPRVPPVKNTGKMPSQTQSTSPALPPSNSSRSTVSQTSSKAQPKAKVVMPEQPRSAVMQEAGLPDAVSISKVPLERMDSYIASVERRQGYQSLMKDDTVLKLRFEALKNQANIVRTTVPQLRADNRNRFAEWHEKRLQRLYKQFADDVSTTAVKVGRRQGNSVLKDTASKVSSQSPPPNLAAKGQPVPVPKEIDGSPAAKEIHTQAPTGILEKWKARAIALRDRFLKKKPSDPKKQKYSDSISAKSTEPDLDLDEAAKKASATAPAGDPKAKPGLLGRALGLGKKAVVTTAWVVAPNAIMTLMSGGFNNGIQASDLPVSAELTADDTTPWTAAESQLEELTNPSPPALDVLESVMQSVSAAEGTTMEQLLANGGTGEGGQRARVAVRLRDEHGVCWPIARCLVNHLTLQDATTCFEYQCNDPTQNPTAAMAPAE